MIRQVDEQSDFRALARLLNEAFGTVAEEFGLTRENSPSNNAFISGEQLKSQLTANREFYVYLEKDQPAGFIAIEKSMSKPGTFYLEKLAVAPEYRHSGVGRRLMDFGFERVKELGGARISIGLIDSNRRLKSWYARQGYTVCEIKQMGHLPFKVCMMQKEIENKG